MAMQSDDTCFTSKLIEDVQSTFSRIETALKSREIQLLRQIDVIIQQYKLSNGNMKCFNKINVVFENEIDILKAVSNFGIIDFEGISLENNIYKIEEYENPNCDHVCMFKCLKNIKNAPDVIRLDCQNKEKSCSSIAIDKSCTKSPKELKSQFKSPSIENDDFASTTQSIVQTTSNELEDTVKFNAVEEPVKLLETSLGASFFQKSDESLLKSKELRENLKFNKNFDTNETFVNISTEETITVNTSVHTYPNMTTTMTNIMINPPLVQEVQYPIDNRPVVLEANSELNRFKAELILLHDSISKIFESPKRVDCIKDKIDIKNKSSDNICFPKSQSSPLITRSHRNKLDKVRKVSLEHPIQIQQWMNQLISEPENDPVQNSELLEHINLTSTI